MKEPRRLTEQEVAKYVTPPTAAEIQRYKRNLDKFIGPKLNPIGKRRKRSR